MIEVGLITSITMVPLACIFYGYFLIAVLRQSFARIFRRQFFRTVVSVLNNNPSNEEKCIEQVELNFGKLSERYPATSSRIKRSTSLLEDMVHYYDLDGKGFETRFGLKITNDVRNRVVEIIDKIKEQNPFGSLSQEDAGSLRDLKRSIETGNRELGFTTLSTVSKRIQTKERNIEILEKRTTTAIIIALIGAFLTSFFGLLSFTRL